MPPKHLNSEQHRGLVPQDQLGTGSDGSGDHFLADDQTYKTILTVQDLQGLAWKYPVVAATTVAGTLASSFENGDTIDGITLATGYRILIKDQADPAENGIYVVNASGAPTRAGDADSGAELVAAAVSTLSQGSNTNSSWVCITPDPITLGTTDLTFEQIRDGGTGFRAGGLPFWFWASLGISAADAKWMTIQPLEDPDVPAGVGLQLRGNDAPGTGLNGGDVNLYAGDNPDDSAYGAFIKAQGAQGAVHGRVFIYTDDSTGAAYEVLTAVGDDFATWQAIDGGSA